MINGRFQILLRRRQNQFEGTDVVLQCNPLTDYAEYVPGTVDNSSDFMDIAPENTWYDLTDYIEPDGINKLSFSWDKVNSGNSTNSTTNPDGSNYDKGLTSDLTFFGKSFQFIYDWLLDSECQILNTVEVKIIDLIAEGTYRIFEIKADNLEYAPIDEPCQIHIKLREQDSVWHCAHKFFIWDNHQNWFKDDSTFEHPCFLTCIEPRPRLVNSIRMALLIFWDAFKQTISTVSLGLAGQIINLFTDNHFYEDAKRVLNNNRFVDAPLIRTYIQNIAAKCGLSMDTIFDEGQQWQNLCLFYPQGGFMHESEGDDVLSPSLSFHYDNRWLITMPELLDKLKTVFAAEWYITPNNTIVFKHTKDLINLDPIYDFTAEGAAPIYDLRYTFNGNKKAAYGRYEYQTDGSDLASQETSTLYNDIVDYDGPANNPMLEGEKRKDFEFAPTGFIRDGRAKDYLRLLIEDGKTGAQLLMAVIVIVLASLVDGALTLGAAFALAGILVILLTRITRAKNKLLNAFVNNPAYDGAVRLTSEQTLAPRLILWDGLSKRRAKVVARSTNPLPNTYYNPTSVPYNEKNKIDIDNPDLNIYNYPLYFDGDFVGNMFDQYHDPIDNPLKTKETHQDAKWNIDLCEDMLNLFGVFENQYAQIGKIVKIEDRENYDVYVRIGNINVDYDSNKINLKGTVIRRVNAPVIDISCNTFHINERCLVINGSHININ